MSEEKVILQPAVFLRQNIHRIEQIGAVFPLDGAEEAPYVRENVSSELAAWVSYVCSTTCEDLLVQELHYSLDLSEANGPSYNFSLLVVEMTHLLSP